MRKLAGVERPSALVLYTSPAWKRFLLRTALGMAEAAGGKFPVAEFMKRIMADPAMRERGKEVQAYAGKLAGRVVQLTPAERLLVTQGPDEAAVLRPAAGFLAEELGIPKVVVHVSDAPDAPDHPKRAVAAPLKPGIAFT